MRKTGTRMLCLLLLIVMSLGLFCGSVWAEQVDVADLPEFTETADVTVNKEFKISAEESLRALAAANKPDDGNGGYNLSGVTFYLANDIILTEDWTPIGGNVSYAGDAFAGTFDGNGYAIRGLSVNTNSSNGVGLFGFINNAVIRNVAVDGNITSSNSAFVGGIAGKTNGNAVIEDCSFAGSITSKKTGANAGVGGIAGRVNSGTLTITGCANLADITGTTAGGILGYSSQKAVMENCYNNGTITGSQHSAGIAAFVTNAGTSMANCYSGGAVIVPSHAYGSGGGISGYCKGSCSNSYYLSPETEKVSSGCVIAGEKIDTVVGLAEKLGAAFTTDKTGNVILQWQSGGTAEPVKPSIAIRSDNGATLWVKQGSGNPNGTVLQVTYKEMGGETPAVIWTIDKETILAGQLAENSNNYIVTARKGGVATVTAAVEYKGETYEATYEITVVPHFTTAEIKNIAPDYAGNIAVGQTVAACLNTTGGVFDGAEYPGLCLTYQWYHGSNPIAGATGDVYTISEDFAEWDKIGVEIKCNGQTVHSYLDQQVSVRTIDHGKLYPLAYGEDFIILPKEIKEDSKLDFPDFITKDGVTAQVEWSGFNGIISADGSVNPPETGKTDVKLTAKFIYNDAYFNRDFDITVWSREAVDADANDKQMGLKEAVASLGNGYVIYPVYGKDGNVNEILTNALAAKGYEDIAVSVKAVKEIYGGAGIASDGRITYFYADPNSLPAIKHGSYQVTFTLAKDGVTLDYGDVPVIIYWDVDKVKAAMTEEILDKITLDEETLLTENINLPKVVDEKKWVQIDWQSSNEQVIAIRKKNQTTGDTLFAPYVGVVKQGRQAQMVTLTAAFTFQLTNDVTGRETPIVLYKTFDATVAPLDAGQAKAVEEQLLSKLDQGFAAKGLHNAVTGVRLTADENGVYVADNDIQLPIPRDFGVDGKYYPITMSSNDESVLKTPDVANAALVEVYRPGIGKGDKKAVFTVTMQDKDTSITASRSFEILVPSLTQEEVAKELALMERVKAAYFEGLKGRNAAKNDVRTDLTPFQEVYADINGELVWVRNYRDKAGYGIVPTPIEGWEDLELWRLFKSSNPNVISHETLQVTRQPEAKGVTVSSYLSSETLGRYGKLYGENPALYGEYAPLAGLYYQPVSTDGEVGSGVRMLKKAAPTLLQAEKAKTEETIVVRGTKNPDSAVPVVETITVSFSLLGLDGEEWIGETALKDLEESATVYDVFTRMLTEKGYTATRQKGTYIVSVSGVKGALGEKEYGERSGWMYRVNGKVPDVYMGACPLHDGDVIQVFYSRDGKKDDPSGNWSSGGSKGAGGNVDSEGAAILVEKSKQEGAYDIMLPQGKNGWQKVVIAAGTNGQLVVKVEADGKEEVMKKSLVIDGKAKFFLKENATVKLTDFEHDFADVSKDAWYEQAVNFVAGRQLFSGVGENTFAPEGKLSRGMLVTALYRLEEPENQRLKQDFVDVAAGAWYEKPVAWGAQAGIITGYENGAFGPNDAITREQLAAMLFRYGKTISISTSGRDSLTAFADGTLVSPWAKEAMTWAVDSGIISGTEDGKLLPAANATRAEAAAMIQRFISFMLQ